ncbi:uncharacterized protein ARMOST_09880 [Armillaria ostoyae]|uniref:Integrase core domain-containing protein n=1 Tax=Armillaria ostoyae TaxID=47428 RepID=A0A284RCR7_ARMOS|nr:uncharacterized protein ARMOST_09880 [Armillaria ostoyae]
MVWGVPIRLRGDHGVENLYATQWMENYRGVLTNAYLWGRSVHNTQAEHMWVETSRSCMDDWYTFFMELEASYGLDHDNSAHIWLLQHLFLSTIDADALQWVDWWNNHPIPLEGKRLETPSNMWIESQLMDGLRGLEHIALTDLLVVDPFAAIPRMGVNQDILRLLQQRHQALTPDVLAHLDDGQADVLLPQNFSKESLAYMPCEPPNCPLSPEEVQILDCTLQTSSGMGDETMAGCHVLWIHALETMNAILIHRQG